MSTSKLKPEVIETVKGIPCTALIYAQSSHYFNTVTGDQIPVGTPVGVKFGEHEGAPSILFKDLVKIKENPRKYKKVLDMAVKLNIMEGRQNTLPWEKAFEI